MGGPRLRQFLSVVVKNLKLKCRAPPVARKIERPFHRRFTAVHQDGADMGFSVRRLCSGTLPGITSVDVAPAQGEIVGEEATVNHWR